MTFPPEFTQRLKQDGFNPQLVAEGLVEAKDQLRYLRELTSYSNELLLTALGSNKLSPEPRKKREKSIDDWETLIDLGADPNAIPQILKVEKDLKQIEFYRTLSPRMALLRRLAELSVGRTVPVTVFNCFSFQWTTNPNSYPSCSILPDTDTAISLYYQDNIRLLRQQLTRIGNPDFTLIIPDSEALDDRLWPFTQSLAERVSVINKVKNNLQAQLPDMPVFFWSEFCNLSSLNSPVEYTTTSYEKITTDPLLAQKVERSLDNERRFFGTDLGFKTANKISESLLYEKYLWYCAMYCGEGRALSQAGALVLNFEEITVPRWFQIGADSQLAIITPVQDINIYYQWKNKQNVMS